MHTSGPVTKTLIPMAALDNLVGALVFFIVIALVPAHISTTGVPVCVVLLLVFLPVLIGIVTGFIASLLLRRMHTPRSSLIMLIVTLLATDGVGFCINSLLPTPVLNFLLLGMAYSTVAANMIPLSQLGGIMKAMNPVICIGLIILILNLGAPLDYHLIFGAGLYTAIYIVSRAVGKYAGAYFGAADTHAPDTVKNYLGFTLLPHSGVSLVFTDIAVSVLSVPARNALRSFRAPSPPQPSSTISSPYSWPKMYHYYSCKDDLFPLLVKELFQALAAQLEHGMQQRDRVNPLATIQQFFMIREQYFQ